MKTRIVLAVTMVAFIAGCHEPLMTELQPIAGDRFTFTTIGDSRADMPIVQPQAYRDCIAEINRLNPQPAVVINVGDLILGYTEDDPGLKLARQEWDEFDRVTRTIRAPVRLVAGNHDVWDVPSYNLYRQRYGKTYYSFNYANSHFVILNSEELDETGNIPVKIEGKQFEWLAADLAAHREMAHKFVFLHRPLWGSHRDMDTSGWNQKVHPLLAKYGVDIVFAGHDHQYVNYGIKDSVQYYVTGGGGAGLGGGREVGGFHHFMVTTVDGEKVSSVVVESNGNILPHTVVTAEMAEMWQTFVSALTFPGVEIPEDKHVLAFEKIIKNPLTSVIEVRYAWDTSGTSWSIEPAEGVLRIPAKRQATLGVNARFEPGRTIPVPNITSKVFVDGEHVTEVVSRLQPLMRQNGVAVRLAQAPTIDGAIGQGEYGNAPINSDFVDYRGLGVPEHQTRFMMAYDDKALYVAVIADEDEPQAIAAQPHKRDGDVWRDDDVELFIDATFDRKTYHQFLVNTLAVQADAIGGPGHGDFGDMKWNGKWRAAVEVGGDHFVVEFAIPFETLGVPAPKPGDQWGLNVCRSRQGEGKYSGTTEMGAWSIPYANFHVPSHFGNVTFK